MADKLFVQSGKSNCKIDNDKILLDLSNIAMAKYIKPVPRNVEKPPTTDVALLVTPPLSLPTKNVAAYLAGYILRKIPVNECGECSDQLLLPQLLSEYDELSAYKFLRNKTYKEAGCLVYPTIAMVQFLENLENVFCAVLKGLYICHLSLDNCVKVQINTQFLTCSDITCKLRVQNMVKLYMKFAFFMPWSVAMHTILKTNHKSRTGKC